MTEIWVAVGGGYDSGVVVRKDQRSPAHYVFLWGVHG